MKILHRRSALLAVAQLEGACTPCTAATSKKPASAAQAPPSAVKPTTSRQPCQVSSPSGPSEKDAPSGCAARSGVSGGRLELAAGKFMSGSAGGTGTRAASAKETTARAILRELHAAGEGRVDYPTLKLLYVTPEQLVNSGRLQQALQQQVGLSTPR